MENPGKISFVAFQPCRLPAAMKKHARAADEARATRCRIWPRTSAPDRKIEPTRDWFPISLISTFSAFADLSHGPERVGLRELRLPPKLWGGYRRVDQQRYEGMAPVPSFLSVPQLVEDIKKVTDAARGKNFSNLTFALACSKITTRMGRPGTSA